MGGVLTYERDTSWGYCEEDNGRDIIVGTFVPTGNATGIMDAGPNGCDLTMKRHMFHTCGITFVGLVYVH